MLLASTSEVYGDPQVHPQPETYWGYVNPTGPRSCYDEGKRVAEALMVAYEKQVSTIYSVKLNDQLHPLCVGGRSPSRNRPTETQFRYPPPPRLSLWTQKLPNFRASHDSLVHFCCEIGYEMLSVLFVVHLYEFLNEIR